MGGRRRRTASCFRSRARASRTNRRVLAEAGDSIKRFLNSGVTELGDRLGPLLWQFAPTKKFDEADFGDFLELLPRDAGRAAAAPCRRGAPRQLPRPGLHRADPQVQRRRGVRRARDLSGHRRRRRPTSSICACRRARTRSRPAIRRRSWTPGRSALATWAEGGVPKDLAACRCRRAPPKAAPRDVFVYVIHEGKVRAPAAAMALIERLKA